MKRPLAIIAREMNLEEGLLDELLAGNVEIELAQQILKRINLEYPVALASLWVEPRGV